MIQAFITLRVTFHMIVMTAKKERKKKYFIIVLQTLQGQHWRTCVRCVLCSMCGTKQHLKKREGYNVQGRGNRVTTGEQRGETNN